MPVTRYIWDTESDNVLMETDDMGAVTAEYTHEPGQFGELISQERNGQTSVYHYDGQGSTRELTDENQNVTDTYTYTAFGEEVAKTGTTVNPYRYIGELGYQYDEETGDYYFREIIYSPVIARRLSIATAQSFDVVNTYIHIPMANFSPGSLESIFSAPAFLGTLQAADVGSANVLSNVTVKVPGSRNNPVSGACTTVFHPTKKDLPKSTKCPTGWFQITDTYKTRKKVIKTQYFYHCIRPCVQSSCSGCMLCRITAFNIGMNLTFPNFNSQRCRCQ